MEFWVYENWRARGHQARVHHGDCRFCNAGKGLHGGTRSDNGKWHGPFATANDAFTRAEDCATDARWCQACAR